MMLMSNWWNSATLVEYAGTFDPAYLNLDYNDKDAWKIYAAKVRDLMSKMLKIPQVDMSYKENLAYGSIFKLICKGEKNPDLSKLSRSDS